MSTPAPSQNTNFAPVEQNPQGLKHRRNALVCGIIGLFLFGVPLGVVAFLQSRQAEKHGVRSTAGKVLGVIDVVLGVIVVQVWLRTMR